MAIEVTVEALAVPRDDECLHERIKYWGRIHEGFVGAPNLVLLFQLCLEHELTLRCEGLSDLVDRHRSVLLILLEKRFLLLLLRRLFFFILHLVKFKSSISPNDGSRCFLPAKLEQVG